MNEPQRYAMDSDTVVDCTKLIEMALAEDIGAADLNEGRDCTTDSIVPPSVTGSAAFVSRAEGIVCGVEVAKLIIDRHALTLSLDVHLNDGDAVKHGETIAVVSGPAAEILVLERTCLNFMCRLSGISSLANQYATQIKGTKACVLDTRKTTPGWRRLEKYAVACGGGQNHRMGLYDAVMIKDNHLAFRRSQAENKSLTIPNAIDLARNWINENADSLPHGKQTVLQVEVDNLEQLAVALSTSVDIVLLDNMSNDQLSSAVAMRNEQSAHVLLEASGGVNLETIAGIASTGVERISVGALTHSATNFDIGLDWTID
jgi:nicotinate-nucleotide pyrophosphorylase (carboxylating)